MSAASPTVVGGLIFCISATPPPGSLFPLFHDTTTLLNENTFYLIVKSLICLQISLWHMHVCDEYECLLPLLSCSGICVVAGIVRCVDSLDTVYRPGMVQRTWRKWPGQSGEQESCTTGPQYHPWQQTGNIPPPADTCSSVL